MDFLTTLPIVPEDQRAYEYPEFFRDSQAMGLLTTLQTVPEDQRAYECAKFFRDRAMDPEDFLNFLPTDPENPLAMPPGMKRCAQLNGQRVPLNEWKRISSAFFIFDSDMYMTYNGDYACIDRENTNICTLREEDGTITRLIERGEICFLADGVVKFEKAINGKPAQDTKSSPSLS
ncbi:uncharacterized protein BDV14DRAFT_182246 [Aspergillus stella-maris]|uniref:uncharacterized protein n=1 Tax=Aspergillus stella-maris TaxID=1810926 RepID=UPI003CCD53E9